MPNKSLLTLKQSIKSVAAYASRHSLRLFFITCIAFLSTGALAKPAIKEVERNRVFIDEAFAQWANGETSFFDDVLDENVVWTIKGSSPTAGIYKGRKAFVEQAVRPFAARLSSPVKPVSRQIWAESDYVIARWDGVGVARDGQAYRNSYVWIFRMRNGRAVEVTAYLDLAPYDDVLKRITLPQ